VVRPDSLPCCADKAGGWPARSWIIFIRLEQFASDRQPYCLSAAVQSVDSVTQKCTEVRATPRSMYSLSFSRITLVKAVNAQKSILQIFFLWLAPFCTT
jgi:hypothetical protein